MFSSYWAGEYICSCYFSGFTTPVLVYHLDEVLDGHFQAALVWFVVCFESDKYEFVSFLSLPAVGALAMLDAFQKR